MVKWRDVRTFLYDSRYVIIFFIVLDFLTTYVAISAGLGYEGNPVMAHLLESAGFISLLMVKLLFLILLYRVYIECKNKRLESLWSATRNIIAVMGIVIICNNMFVIIGLPDFYSLGVLFFDNIL
ncbi:conserved hypothetical protein [Methanosalsum zhilinae DSM 4017]|uniref:DUF5658 domain-containing protein n=1 Tax=Methanosalsum zhilinae (strain DSM 4017 / NBRC 107636 / OCM 62 / WeN5) TaxID=679901 RepID=F7XNY6_METZD|nr:DUF5658 family protein [Methanosalsum zhilinae]AEH60176.1 conserved hypothetical protein [Methanosalsum zhilinae DSM 4017]